MGSKGVCLERVCAHCVREFLTKAYVCGLDGYKPKNKETLESWLFYQSAGRTASGMRWGMTATMSGSSASVREVAAAVAVQHQRSDGDEVKCIAAAVLGLTCPRAAFCLGRDLY
jgi:hypothetical protein